MELWGCYGSKWTREVEMVLCSVGRVKWYVIGLLWELGPFWFTLMGEGSRVRVGKYGSQLVGSTRTELYYCLSAHQLLLLLRSLGSQQMD
ncbi:hypothetical protein M0R45_036787 [Rubus argutus]|uniref:Uncharacterized protein n=1 Tax=Rubus argutus TaxID=59490 RepID=A0AAW1W2J1_RUBAR